MTNDYDAITAFHYAAYRPSLHATILKMCITLGHSYSYGLDIGSGTGQSSIALTNFCMQVVGIEPSSTMLSKAIVHPKVSYKKFDKHHIDFQDNTFDIITLAGSLWYAKSQQLLDEIGRVGKESAFVVVYDFEIVLAKILSTLGFKYAIDDDLLYNHKENFSDLETNQISLVEEAVESIQFSSSPIELAHLILSVKKEYHFFRNTLGEQNLHSKLVKRLEEIFDKKEFKINAKIFFTSYAIH